MRNSLYVFSGLVSVLFTVACATNSAPPDPTPGKVHLPVGGGLPNVNHVPGGGHSLMFDNGDTFTFIGPTAPGTASYTAAPLIDPEMGQIQPTFGTADSSITINGVLFAAPAMDSISLALTDENNDQYVALDSHVEYPGPGGVDYATEVTVFVKRSDFQVGATVDFDGVDRVALFANGPADAMDPTLVGAAVTGSVTFTAGDLGPTGALSATVTGDFGQIDYVPPPPPDGMITAGTYTLAVVGPAQIECDGTLAGHEADFAGITLADLGLAGASVTVTTPSATVVDIAGAPGFAGTFELDSLDDPPGLFAGFTDETGNGPSGTTFVGKYLAFDGGSATAMFVNGSVGGGYAGSDGMSGCTVYFGASLTAP